MALPDPASTLRARALLKSIVQESDAVGAITKAFNTSSGAWSLGDLVVDRGYATRLLSDGFPTSSEDFDVIGFIARAQQPVHIYNPHSDGWITDLAAPGLLDWAQDPTRQNLKKLPQITPPAIEKVVPKLPGWVYTVAALAPGRGCHEIEPGLFAVRLTTGGWWVDPEVCRDLAKLLLSKTPVLDYRGSDNGLDMDGPRMMPPDTEPVDFLLGSEAAAHAAARKLVTLNLGQ